MAEQQLGLKPEEREEQTLQDIAKQMARQKAMTTAAIAENYPQLMQSLLSPKVIKDNHYDTLLPFMAFANISREAGETMALLMPEICFNYYYWARQGWVTDDLAYDWASKWTTEVEITKAEGSERISKLFFTDYANIKMSKEKPKAGFEKQ